MLIGTRKRCQDFTIGGIDVIHDDVAPFLKLTAGNRPWSRISLMLISLRRVVLPALLLSLTPFGTGAASGDEEQQRRDYAAAQEALQSGNLARYLVLRQRLDTYVFRGYLDYED